MTLFVLCIFLIVVIFRYIKKESTVALLMGWSIISFPISMGGGKFDSLYIIDIILGITVFLREITDKEKNKEKRPELLTKYMKIVIYTVCVYMCSWMLFNRNNFAMTASNVLGAIKLIVIMELCYIMNRKVKKLIVRDEMSVMVVALVLINVVAVIYEMTDMKGSVEFLKNYVLNDAEIRYLESVIEWGYYNRYYGLFAYPMQLGMFSTMAIAYLLAENKKIKGILKIVFIGCAVFIGLMSSTKSFVLGTAIVFIGYVIGELIGKNGTQKKVLTLFVCTLLIVLFVMNFASVQIFLEEHLGSITTKYLNVLTDTSNIFTTRFGEQGRVNAMKEVVKEYWIFGVGPSNIGEEEIMDSSFYIIMHNGGIAALMGVAVFYFKLIESHMKEWSKLLMIVVIFVTGMGFLTWISATISTWLIYELCVGEREITL